MPERSRFYGIIIRMYCEVGPHLRPISMPITVTMRPCTGSIP
jgi:hypothetical protein